MWMPVTTLWASEYFSEKTKWAGGDRWSIGRLLLSRNDLLCDHFDVINYSIATAKTILGDLVTFSHFGQ